MRRFFLIIACVLVGMLAGAAWLARALYGPEPSNLDVQFQILFQEGGTGAPKYDTLTFPVTPGPTGWDFEDRDGYECANVAQYDEQGNLLLLFDFEQSKDYLNAAGTGNVFEINDKYGAEAGDPQFPVPPNLVRDCGNELHNDPNNSRWAPSGEDHFPHYITSHQTVEPVQFYKDGVPWLTLPGIINADCDRGYWTPGDEPGEIVLWWDVDGPTNAHMDGGAPLNCGGGATEPVPVARGFAAFMAPNIGVCISDMDLPNGQRCSGMTQPPPTPVQLGSGRSVLTCPGGSTPAVESTEPLIVVC